LATLLLKVSLNVRMIAAATSLVADWVATEAKIAPHSSLDLTHVRTFCTN
jgi:hypothetical protein